MREMAKKRQNLQADKMLEQSNKRFKPAEEGENVNVPIPEVDRGRLDPPNFTAVVQERSSETGLYTLGTKAGTLNTRFSRNQFNVIQRNLFPFYRVSSFIGSQKLVSACWGSNRLVPPIIPHHQQRNLHL